MNVLLAGETFAATTSVAVGGDVLTSATSTNGATAFNAALAAEGIAVTQIGGDRCAAEFPYDLDALARYQAVVISDVGALTLLVTPDARAGHVGVNRLEVLKAYVESGGGLMLAGGYMGFQGMFGTARFHDTPVEDVLPVRCLPFCDGMEVPQGLQASILQPSHPIFAGMEEALPAILGMNKLDFRRDGSSRLLATCHYRGTDWPLLAVRNHGRGRTVAWATDIGPHWLSQDFLAWPLYGKLMANMIRWLAGSE
ncbi:glutamine amidotransferase [Mesorhizobium sp. AR10]|uniref:glutamine amidotransferase n=1 Tax=Mesorhizobium sp. AR10 TaxID=2865839 RepID=UPI00215F75F8|nr:glutamine amidotransferase [Mesorhizobium sp. AR10]UVK38550.1 glutamine amidotransferase [Mesorhizobium sp. AR10]